MTENTQVPVECLVMGPLRNNVYIASDGEGTLVVDPSCKPQIIMGELKRRKLDAIFVTHFHSDHTGALAELKALTGAKVYASVQDAEFVRNPKKVGTSPIPVQEPCDVDVELNDGDTIQVGGMTWKFLLTPGHSKGSGCFYLEGKDGKAPVLFSGDTLFRGTTGRTDFFGGSSEEMRESLVKLSTLSEETIVFPGHEGFTSIRAEKQTTMPRWGVFAE